MKSVVFFLASLFITIFPLFSQSSEENRVIHFPFSIKVPAVHDFYVDSLMDCRPFKYYTGLLSEGGETSLRVQVSLDKQYFTNLKTALKLWAPRRGTERPVDVKVWEVFLWEQFFNNAMYRFAEVIIEVLENGQPRGFYQAVQKESSFGAFFTHEELLERAFRSAIEQYAKKGKTMDPHFMNAPENLPSKGAYLSFLDFKYKRKSLTNISLSPTGNSRLFHYKTAVSDPEYDGFFAYEIGNDLFLHASIYSAKANYFSKVLERGRYLFLIDKINTKDLTNYLIGYDVSKKSVELLGIIIDSETGIPYYITDEFLYVIMEPYPDLQKQYLFKDIVSYSFQLERIRRVISEINKRIASE